MKGTKLTFDNPHWDISLSIAFSTENKTQTQQVHYMRHWTFTFSTKLGFVSIPDPLNVYCLIREEYSLAGRASAQCD